MAGSRFAGARFSALTRNGFSHRARALKPACGKPVETGSTETAPIVTSRKRLAYLPAGAR